MAIDSSIPGIRRFLRPLSAMALVLCLTACGTGPLVGLVYTKVRLPLTRDLHATPLPGNRPYSDRVIEIKEPFTGIGLYTRVSVNAIGEIARQNDVDPLYFADQEIFSVLGIWKTHRVFLYGDGPEGDAP